MMKMSIEVTVDSKERGLGYAKFLEAIAAELRDLPFDIETPDITVTQEQTAKDADARKAGAKKAAAKNAAPEIQTPETADAEVDADEVAEDPKPAPKKRVAKKQAKPAAKKKAETSKGDSTDAVPAEFLEATVMQAKQLATEMHTSAGVPIADIKKTALDVGAARVSEVTEDAAPKVVFELFRLWQDQEAAQDAELTACNDYFVEHFDAV